MQKPLVTLLTPCYNTGNYIHRLLESVIAQTYPSIEMYVIDDGSTDNSKEVVCSYKEKFYQKGYALNYIYQNNSGQSVAIQNGLRYVKGKYLAWPDSDDFYATEDAIEKMVAVLESSSEEIAMVRTQEQILDEKTFECISISGKNVKEVEEKSLFTDCLFVRNGFYFPPGAYMVDYKCLVDSAEWPMYTSKNAGQNWQLFLPILWNKRCCSIPEVLYSVLSRSASHSRGYFCGYEKSIAKLDAYSETILKTLDKIKNMPSDVCDGYKRQINDKYLIERMMLSFKYGKPKEYKTYYKKLFKKEKKYALMACLVDLRLSRFASLLFTLYRSVRRRICALVKSVLNIK